MGIDSVLPAGIEPAHMASETNALSTELREQICTAKIRKNGGF